MPDWTLCGGPPHEAEDEGIPGRDIRPPAGAHGKAPSPVEQMWIAAAPALTPDKSLQRIQDSAKQLFTSVAAVTALITGFGLISGANLRANPALLILAIALTAVSLTLAMASLIVNPQKVRITSIESVRDYYEHDLLWKGRFIQFGGISFALALLFAAAPRRPAPRRQRQSRRLRVLTGPEPRNPAPSWSARSSRARRPGPRCHWSFCPVRESHRSNSSLTRHAPMALAMPPCPIPSPLQG